MVNSHLPCHYHPGLILEQSATTVVWLEDGLLQCRRGSQDGEVLAAPNLYTLMQGPTQMTVSHHLKSVTFPASSNRWPSTMVKRENAEGHHGRHSGSLLWADQESLPHKATPLGCEATQAEAWEGISPFSGGAPRKDTVL